MLEYKEQGGWKVGDETSTPSFKWLTNAEYWHERSFHSSSVLKGRRNFLFLQTGNLTFFM